MLTLKLIGSGLTLNLNQLLETDEGVQAIAGLTGFGLPPVAVQWSEGAGDGATYESHRFQPRDIDLPLEYVAPDRAALRDMARTLSMILAGPCVLEATDTSTDDTWTMNVMRTGGGEIAYGAAKEGTDGDDYLSIIITVRAGDPFWYHADETAVSIGGGPFTDPPLPASLFITNDGSMPVKPIWELTGPGMNFKITSPLGEVVEYEGLLRVGEKVTIDAANGTVVDSDGNARYHELGRMPRFFSLSPGGNVIETSVDQTSTEFAQVFLGGRKNRITNPSFRFNSTGWTLTNASYDATNLRVNHNKRGPSTTPQNRTPFAVTTCSGLTVGQEYQVTVPIYQELPTTPPVTSPLVTTRKAPAGIAILNGEETVEVVAPLTSGSHTLTTTFIAKSEVVILEVRQPSYEWRDRGAYRSYTEGLCRLLPMVYLGDPGTIFDGNTAATADFAYSWLGAANASISQETPTSSVGSLPKAGIACRFHARDWWLI